ncbi:17017_t:CDS:2, partial [Racocetra fulgida]
MPKTKRSHQLQQMLQSLDNDSEVLEEGTMINEKEADVIMSNSKRTHRRKKAKNKEAAIGTVSITSFFLKVKKNNLVSNEEDNQNQDNQNMDDNNTETYQQSFEDIIENVDYNDGENQKQ